MDLTIPRCLFKSALPLLAILFVSLPATALQPEQDESTPSVDHRTDPRFAVAPTLDIAPPRSQKSQGLFDLQGFFALHSADWEVRWDRRNDRPNLIQGAGIPILAGRANGLQPRPAQDGKKAVESTSLDDVGDRLLHFLTEHPDVLRVAHLDLRLDRQRSSSFGKDQYFWHVEFQQFHQGVPVEGAYVYFRLNHGNLVQFGAHRVAEIQLEASPALSRAAALRQTGNVAGLAHKVLQEDTERGGLRIYPMMDDHEMAGQRFAGSPGFGYQHLLVWELYLRDGDRPYKAVVDAAGGEVLELVDLRAFAEADKAGFFGGFEEKQGRATGGVFVRNHTVPLQEKPLPYLEVKAGARTLTTDSDGEYPYPGGTVEASLSGLRAEILDDCGDSLLSSTDGNLAFGGATASNCRVPSQGGAGNTNAARTTYYHLSQIHTKAGTFLPHNSWLAQPLVANVNFTVSEGIFQQTCNAFWNGSEVTFFPQGGGCANTGEMPAVIVHEWGHGMDENAGGVPAERGSGEAVGDTFAFLETDDPCIGQNFRSTSCHNCRNLCKGVRDVYAFSLDGESDIARPDTITSNNGIDCDRFLTSRGEVNCPFRTQGGTGFPYQGPMGYQGHCESLIASTANWDLLSALQAELGTQAGLDHMNTLWYGSLESAGSAYRVVAGGQCNPNASVDGCGQNNWYTLYLTLDDDDGNMDNGTPNGCRIWDAFDAHGIACGDRPQCSNANQPPVANFTESCNGLSCTFDASGSTDDDQIVHYGWSFGDAGSGSGVMPLHNYTAGGSYSVTLTVTDSDGATDSTSKTVTVEAPLPCEITAFDVESFADGLPRVSWSTTCQQGDGISVQVKTTTQSFLPSGCDLEGALWDGNRNGSRTADYMAGGYGSASQCPAVEQARFWIELLDGNEVIDERPFEVATFDPPPLPCDLDSFSIENRGTGLLPIVSWSTDCPNPGPVSVQVRTTTLSQNLPTECRLDDALWDGNKSGSRTVDYMDGGYGPNNDCPHVGEASFWVELWHGTQLIRRSNFSTARYTPLP